MTSLFSNLFPQRNRRSQVPVEELDVERQLSPDEGGVRIASNSTLDVEEGRNMTESTQNQSHNTDEEQTLSNSNSSSAQIATNVETRNPVTRPFSFRSSSNTRSNTYSRTDTTDSDSEEESITDPIEEQNRRTFSRAQRRRHSTLLLILLFFYFKLWIEALVTGDSGLLFICIISTLWISGFVRRHQELAVNRQINAERRDNGVSEEEQMLERLGMSYQAQLSAAIWESRMLALMGGISTREEEDAEGVSEDSKSQWETYEAVVDSSLEKGHYGKLCPSKGGSHSQEKENPALILQSEEDATCSICLCEYEHKEQVVRLPCGHMFHYDCISSWTKNHTRCPLCNHDLSASDNEPEGTASLRVSTTQLEVV